MKFLDEYFGISASGSNLYREIIAGVTTFFAMSYILFANPAILSEAGMDKSILFTSTAIAAIIGCLAMGIYARLPFALAPGMGLNAFFTYTICLQLGHSWQFALAAVFCEGVVFLLISIFNIRGLIINLIPKTLHYAFCPGIGLFIAFIGLQMAGLVEPRQGTILKLGNVYDPNAILSCVGVVVIGALYMRKIHGGMLLGVAIICLLALPFGMVKIDSLFSLPPNVMPVFMKFDFSELFSFDFICVIILLLSVDIFDTLGTLVGVAESANMIDEKGNVKNNRKAFIADSLSTIFGAMFGTSTTTTYVESSTGVAAGGRTGITAIVTALCFVMALFYYPIFSAVPKSAIAAMLIFAGFNMFMSSPIREINFKDYSESIPAFITLLMMPFTYSIMEGISFGVLSYVFINALSGNFKKIGIGTLVLAIFFMARFVVFKI
ncbi:xanthine/uracil permease [Fibrobacterales bacterium]|nr:xanthine/uracil permease [Fibrobacterales bacterium]